MASLTFFIAPFVLLASLLALHASASSKPNVIIFMADDMGYNDLSSFGSTTIYTPNIDRLASEGIKFTQFYSTAPLCSASRASLLTARNPVRTGTYTNFKYPKDLHYRVYIPITKGALPDTENTMAKLLHNQGYYTALIGKWHIGHNGGLPTQRGFDYFYGLPYSHEEGFPGPFPESFVFPPVPLMENEKIIQQPANLSLLQLDYNQQALQFLENMKVKEDPFFLYFAFETPHVPLIHTAHLSNNSRRGLYGDVVSEMDNAIGAVMSKLEALGMDNNTLVMFSSDNGAWIAPSSGAPLVKTASYPFDGGSNAPFRGGKGSTWEGGSRVPAIFWMPSEISNGAICQSMMSNMDVLPTIADLVGFNLPNDRQYDGVSQWAHFKDNSKCFNRDNDLRQFNFFWRTHLIYAVRYQQYKAHYITRRGFGDEPPIYHDPPLLFNVEWDAAESIELNATEYEDILTIIDNAKTQKEQDTFADAAPPQFDVNDWFIVPCCGKGFNVSEAEMYIDEGLYSLAIWDECTCNYKP